MTRVRLSPLLVGLLMLLSGCINEDVIDPSINDTIDDDGLNGDNSTTGGGDDDPANLSQNENNTEPGDNSTGDNTTTNSTNSTDNGNTTSSPLGSAYLIIHFEPSSDSQIDDNWTSLETFIADADAGNHKLTLAFTHHWASNILANSSRLTQVRVWEANGHELALHHHSRDHPTEWDGYSNQRAPNQFQGQIYLGNMSDLMTLMNQLPAGGNIVTAAGDGRESDWHPSLLYSAEAGVKTLADLVSQPQNKTYSGDVVRMVTKAGFKVHFTSYDLNLDHVGAQINNTSAGDILGFVIQNETYSDFLPELQGLFDLLEGRGMPLRSIGDILANYENETSENSDVGGNDSGESPVLYLSFTLHIEGWTDEETNEAMFERHSEKIQNASDLFSSYGAYLNIEVRPDEFIAAANAWNSTILADLEAAGHTIGIHADIGNSPGTTLASMTNVLTNMKALGEAQGVTIRGVSGICSDLDWVQAAYDAGYEYITSIVEYCMMSMTNETIPEGYESALNCTSPAECHDVAFHAASEYSMHPYRPNNGTDWASINHSNDYPVLIMGGVQQHSFYCLSTHPISGECAFNNGTISAYIAAVELALENLDADYLNTMNSVWSLGADMPVELQHGLFTALQPYIDSGQVELVSVGDIYDLYVLWAQGNGY